MVVTGSDRARWVRRGTTVHVNGFGLFTGLFYVGKTFSANDGKYDKFIVNPSLQIGKSARDYIPGHDPWGASYEALPPSGRRAYLEWLSGSCRNTSIPVQFVRLYAGGLYHRVLIDNGDDRQTVLAEARRLIGIHRENRVLVDLMGKLLAFASAIDYQRGQIPVYSQDWKHTIFTSADVLLRIASLIGSGTSIGVDDAFYYAIERGKIRTPQAIDVEGLRLLWKRLYLGRYPDGIHVDPPNQKLKLVVASPDGVGPAMKVPVPDWCKRLPDPLEATALNERLDALMDDCLKELKSYSRLMKKKPGITGSLEAINVLPKQLVATSLAGRFANVKAVLDGALSKQGVVTSKALKLFEFMELPFQDDEQITPSVRKLISGAMDKMDIAFEPDARYGAMPFTTKGNIVFFRGENGLPVEWEGSYAIHRACADFVIGHVCQRGDQAVAAEKALFEVRRTDVELTDADRMRLAAHARSLVVDLGLRKGAPFRVGKFHKDEFEALARAVIETVAAIPGLSVDAIATVEKFIEKLGRDRKELHTALHRRQPDQEGLVSVVRAEPASGKTIPARAKDESRSVNPSVKKQPSLDLERLQRIEAETVIVTELLSDIFSGDEADNVKSVLPQSTTGLLGLDTAHTDILLAIMAVGEMERVAFETLVKDKRLMPDGVLETINDKAFEAFGEPVIIDDGNLLFEEHLRVEIEKTRVNA